MINAKQALEEIATLRERLEKSVSGYTRLLECYDERGKYVTKLQDALKKVCWDYEADTGADMSKYDALIDGTPEEEAGDES